MSNYTKEQLVNAVDSFPDTLRGMLFSPDIERKVQKVGIETGLLIDQLKILNNITNDAILGLLAGTDIETEIKNSLEITESQSKEIATKISTEIVDPINNLKATTLAEQRAKEENDRIMKDTEARWEAEEKELAKAIAEEAAELNNPQDDPNEYSSETHIEIQSPKQTIMLEKAPDIVYENLPIEKSVEPSFIKLIPKAPEHSLQTSDYKLAPDPLHPFEEKMKTAFINTPVELENIAPVQQEALEPATNYKTQPTPSPQIPPTPATGGLRHDPYREVIE